MGTVRSYPSRELWRLRREWLTRNKKLVLIACAFFLGSMGAATWIGLTVSSRVAWYLVGAVHAGLVATLLHFLNLAVFAHQPRAVYQLRGAWGEDNTRSELQTAKKKRIIWDWIDSISLKAGDLDHVVITREGGVVVLDSKFRTDLTQCGVAEMAASAARARLRTEGLLRTVLPSDRSGRRRSSNTSVVVTSCIVLWGPARVGMPDSHVVGGVHFVDGNNLRQWLDALPPSPVSKEAAADLFDRLANFRASATTRRV